MAAVGTLAGCAGAGGPTLPGRSTAGAAATAAEPWELPPGAYASQRLYRLEFDSAEGDGALRLVLRLADADRYRLTIADRLGRPLYTVDADRAGGFLLDHREHLVCPLSPDVGLEELPIDPLPLSALPSVLLGRLPAVPHGPRPAARGPELAYRDAAGRRWTATLAPEERGGRARLPVRWTLWDDGEPAVWWRLLDDRSMLSDRRRSLRMTWREVGREPLAADLGAPSAPDDYAPGVCGARDPAPSL